MWSKKILICWASIKGKKGVRGVLFNFCEIFKNEDFGYEIFEKGQILRPFLGLAPSNWKFAVARGRRRLPRTWCAWSGPWRPSASTLLSTRTRTRTTSSAPGSSIVIHEELWSWIQPYMDLLSKCPLMWIRIDWIRIRIQFNKITILILTRLLRVENKNLFSKLY